MKKKEEANKKHLIEYGVILAVVVAVYLVFRFTAGNYIAGYVTADLENFTISTEAPVDQEVDEKINSIGEADVILEFYDKPGNRDEIESISRQGFKEKNRFKYYNGVSGKINKEGLDKLRKSPRIKKISIDRELKIDLQDSVPLINASGAWKIDLNSVNITGKGSVCILDTGIAYNHPDLGKNYLTGYDYVNLDNDPLDDNGHGTHVAGIVAANGSTKGVAPSAKIVAVKVCNAGGSCTVSDVTTAIEWCASNKTKYDIKVITMSLGGGIYTSNCDSSYPTITAAANAAVASNIAVFAASGNSGSSTGISAPACISSIIAVGGSDKYDKMYISGNRNSLIGVIAPGVSIKSTYLGGGTAILTGTSMSTPHAAAAANLLQEYSELNGKTLSPGEIKSAMKDNGKQITDSASGLNYARVDVYKALLSLDTSKPSISVVDVIDSNEKWILVNASSDEKLNDAVLQWNNINSSMNGENKVWWRNVSDVNSQNNYNVFGYDKAGNIGDSGVKTINFDNNTNNTNTSTTSSTSTSITTSSTSTTIDSNTTSSTSTVDTSITTTISSGGGSSGGGGGSGGGSGGAATSIATTVQEFEISQTNAESSVASSVATTSIQPETTAGQLTGLTGLGGNVVKIVGSRRTQASLVTIFSLSLIGYFVYRRYLKSKQQINQL